MRRIIKIFLASSIVEFTNERMAIENFIRNVSDKFEEHYDVKIQPLLCENFDDAYTKIRKQEEYNTIIRDSALCFFIFFTKAGEYTREEFEVARKQFEETGSPKIYTYFKTLKDETAEQSLYDFMNELDKALGHYYGTFDHIDTVKLRILLSLKLQEMDFLEIKTDGGKCIVDGVPVLSLDKVSEFANNEMFKQLKDEVTAVEKEYFELKGKYVGEDCDEATCRRYCETATRRQNLLDAIEETQKNIFNMSVRMCKDEVHGEITQRQKEAYRLFEQGDLEGANRILDFAEIKSEYLRRKAIRAAEQKKDAQIFIRETATKIDILKTMKKISGRFEEIEKLYDEITAEAVENAVELDTVYNYVCFLEEQNKHKKAIQIGEKLNKRYSEMETVPEYRKASLFNVLGILYDGQNLCQIAEKYYLKSIEAFELLVEDNSEQFNPGLATIYNNAGLFYAKQGKSQKAEDYFLKATEIRETLVKGNPARFNPDLAKSYGNTGVFYYYQGEQKKAEKYYLKVIKIYALLSKDNPELFKPDLAMSYINVGILYHRQSKLNKAENYYIKTIETFELLAKDNPARFNPDLANCYNNVGAFYSEQGNTKKSEDCFLKAIDIRDTLVKENPARFNPDLAISYYNVGVFYGKQGEPKKAEEYFLKAIEIFELLVDNNDERFNPYLATSYNNAGVFYKNQGHSQKAEEYFLKAIEIRETLAKENPERFNPDLASSYNNAGNFYAYQGKPQKAEEYYLKAKELIGNA